MCKSFKLFYSMTILQMYRRKIFKNRNFWGTYCSIRLWLAKKLYRTACMRHTVYHRYCLFIELLQSFTLRHPMRFLDSVLCISFQVGKAVNFAEIIKNEKNRLFKSVNGFKMRSMIKLNFSGTVQRRNATYHYMLTVSIR